MALRILSTFLFSACALVVAFAEKGSLTFHLDNDLFANTDRDYSNGARISYISPNRTASNFNDIESWLKSVQDRTPKMVTGLLAPSDPVFNFGVSLTQLMYTPADFEPSAPLPGEHPYVGWLGLGFSLHAKDENAVNSIEISVGTTGEYAFAETTQDFIHDIRDIDKFNGWDSQMPSEPTVNLYFTQKRRLFSDESVDSLFGMDTLGEWKLALGTFKTSVELGFVSRVGFNLPTDFSDPRLGPTAYSHKIFDTKNLDTASWSAYGIFGARAAAVAHDITLDGPVFREFEMGIQKEDYLGEAYFGGAVRYKGWEISYAYTFRSKEFKEQTSGPQFGSIAVRCKY